MKAPDLTAGQQIYSIRDRRSWTYVALGLALALMFVSGALIAVDSSQRAVMQVATGEVPADFIARDIAGTVQFATGYVDERLDAIESLEDVEEAQPLVYMESVNVRNENGVYPNFSSGGGRLLFIPSDGQRILTSYRINGEMPSPGTVAIAMETADSLGVGIGDVVVLTFVPYGTITRTVSQIWTQDEFDKQVVYDEDGSSRWYNYIGPDAVVIREHYNPVVMSLDDLPPLIEELPAGPVRDHYVTTATALYLIWIDRVSVLDSASLSATFSDLDAIHDLLVVKGDSFGFRVQSSDLVQKVRLVPDVGRLRTYILGISMPIAALGLYIAVSGASIAADLREDETRRLRSDGASRKQVRSALLTDAVILGAVVGAMGLAGGAIVSRILLDTIVLMSSHGEFTTAPPSAFGISPTTIVLSLLAGVVLVVAVSFGNAWRLSRLDSPPTSRPLMGRKGAFLNLSLDVELIILSLVSVGSILVGQKWTGSHGMDWYFTSPRAFIEGLGLVLLPALPFMLIFSIGRLVTRYPVRIHVRISEFLSRKAGRSRVNGSGNVVRSKSRASSLCVLVGLAIAFGMFSSVTLESIAIHEERTSEFYIGADALVTGYYNGYWEHTAWNPELDFSKVREIDSIQGVDNSVVFQHFVPTVPSSELVAAIAFDPEDYLNTVHPRESCFGEKGSNAMRLLSNGASALITKSYSEYSGVSVGDALTLRLVEYNPATGQRMEPIGWNIDLIVEDVVNDLPGLSYVSVLMSYSALSSVPESNFSHLSNGCGAILDISPDADPNYVAAEALAKFSEAGISATVRTLADEYADIENDPDIGGLADFLYAENAMAIVVAAVGVCVLTRAMILERTRDLDGVPENKVSKGSVAKAIAIEGAALVAVGAIIGSAVALLTAFLFNTVWVPYDYESIPREIVLTGAMWLTFVISFALLAVAAFVSALYDVRKSGQPSADAT